MEPIEAFLKTAQSPALIMALAWILSLHKRLERSENECENERKRNERLTDMLRELIAGQKAHASAIRQIRRLLEREAADETGEFSVNDFPNLRD